MISPRQQVHIILDNLSTHKTPSVREFLEQNPRVRFHFTPTYSSWLNQVELWFAKIERDVIARGIFTSVPDLARKPRRYINAYSANARTIQWKYSAASHRVRGNENSRVMMFSPPFTNTVEGQFSDEMVPMNATLVLGQSDFSQRDPNQGGDGAGANTLNSPTFAVAY